MVMREAGLFDDDMVAHDDASTSIGLGRRLFSEVLASAPDVDAVFCQNDDLAVGALLECWTRGIRIPDDVGICGFNDLDFAEHCEPPLTTVRVPRYDIGYRVADVLLKAIREEKPGEDRIDLGFQIMERGSTR
jgi:LacI family transcriptional regulator, gluconate utilization system Gnt-I transcriptional repressor